MGGIKIDSKYLNPKSSKVGKLELVSRALHPDFEVLLAKVAALSVEKGYQPLNWLDPDNAVTVTKLMAAARRHENKTLKGIDINDEEKTLEGKLCENKTFHLVYAAYSLLMAAVILQEGIKELDDRMFSGGRIK